jgi:integrase/recombinase XerD
MRDRVKDKSYRAYPMGQRAGEYLRWKRGRLTAASYRDYEACLDKLSREYPDLEIESFEPPVGTAHIEELLDRLWGDAAPRTYNKNLSVLKDFFKWAVLRGLLHGDPALPINPHKKRDVHREVFSGDRTAQILAQGPDDAHVRRDRTALRLLLEYGVRKGALQRVQFKHFDLGRRRLTIFTKGEKVRDVPLRPSFVDEVSKLMLESDAAPEHYLLQRHKKIFWKYDIDTGEKLFREKHWPDQPMGQHGLHNWWYRCLERAGIVSAGVTSGEKMHKARHTAGQRVLDTTGNIVAAQKLLGHASVQTTADVYTDWDIDALDRTMGEVLGE